MAEKYLLFTGYHDYYPETAMNDFKGFFNSISDAQEAVKIEADKIEIEYYQIVSHSDMRVVKEGKVFELFNGTKEESKQ